LGGFAFVAELFGYGHFDKQVELVELVHPVIRIADLAGIPIEPPQQVHRQVVVVAVTFAPDFPAPDDRLDIAVARPLHQLVGDFRQGQEQGCAPGAGEGTAFWAVAQDVGALRAHACCTCSPCHHAACRQCIEEDANALGRPAVGAGAAAGSGVAACGDRLLEEEFGQLVHVMFES
jgi:hypothetical protein